jgi:CheY-like chemotaxis protein
MRSCVRQEPRHQLGETARASAGESNNLAQVVEHAVATVTPTAASKGIRLTTTLPDEIIVVDGDADRLRQVVLNVLANAVKFTPRTGSVDVTLARDEEVALLAVTDTGRGIHREFLPHVFERFRQADGAAVLGGLGLGLAIARHIIEQHDGTISADSAGEGRGAVFTVTLPITVKPLRILPLTTGARVELAADDATALRDVRVLVVDDDAETREFLVTVLRQYGADATAVGSALDALGAISRRQPDVLISDIGMPGEDGYALLRRLRALPPEIGGKVPALALSAYSGVDDADRALSAGFQFHLGKPVQPTTLVAAVAMLAGKGPAPTWSDRSSTPPFSGET